MSRHLAKSAFWITVSEIVFNLSGYVIHSVVGRILGPAEYGRYGLVVTLTTMVIILIGNGIPTAMAKYLSEIFELEPQKIWIIKRQAVRLQSVLIGILTVIFFFSAPLIARLLNDPSLTSLFQISSLIIPAFAMASFYFSYYTGLHRFGIQSWLKILRSLFRVVIIISLAYYFKTAGAVSGYIIAPLLVFVVAYFIDKIKISKELKTESSNFAQDNKIFPRRNLINYAWQVIIFFLAYELLISIDLYLVKGILKDDYLTGIYNGALTVGRIPYYIFYALTVILLPTISKSTAENNVEKTGAIISHSLRLMIILLVPMVILMDRFSEPVISLFYGPGYLEAARSMSILVYGVGFLTIFYVLSFVMNGAGKTKIPMIISILGIALNTLLNYILIQRYALIGSAMATSITSFLITTVIIYYVYRDFKISIKLGNVINIALGGLALFFVASKFPGGEFSFILSSLLLFLFYAALLYFLKEITRQDIQYLADIFNKKKPSETKEALSGNELGA